MIPLLKSFGILRVNVPLEERSLQPVGMTLPLGNLKPRDSTVARAVEPSDLSIFPTSKFEQREIKTIGSTFH